MDKFFGKLRNNGIILLAASGLIILTYGFANISANRDFQLARNMDIFFSMIREISLFYVDDTEPEKLIENGIGGVLRGLDPYTTYIPESEKDNYATMTTGRYGGIGALIRQVGDYVMIIEPYENYPAQKSGLRAGDIIIAIEGKSTKGFLVNEISELLKGQPQSNINITIQRNGEPDPITKAITREEVKIDNVAWYGTVADQIGYIQFNGFTENAHQEVRDAMKYLQRSHGIESVILDVRGNPGGLLMEAVNVTNLFVDKDEDIVSTRGKLKQWDHTYRARKNPLDPDIPVVVLVGKSSASASEIVAGALQDLDRGVLVGQRTFGKGLIQTTRQLSYNAQLKITTAKYYTPSGRCIQAMDFSNDSGISYIPDSMINEFRTKGGRIVYDGGGIMPDIEIKEKRTAPVVVNLYARNHIFNYATLYAARNPEIPPVSSFQISDEEYRDFIDFLEEVDFDYQTQTEANLKQLINAAKQEQYYDLSSDLFKELEERIRHDKKKDLETYKDDIKALLREEIASRYYYQKGRIEASLTGDPYIGKAIEILKNRAIYDSILEGSMTYSSERQKSDMTVLGQSINRFNNLINC